MEQMSIRQDQQLSREPHSRLEQPPRQLTTLQEQVRRRHQQSQDIPDSPSRPQHAPAVTWEASAAATRECEDDYDARQMRRAMDEAMAEMHIRQDERRYKSEPASRFDELDDQQIYHDQQLRSQRLLRSQRYMQPQNRQQLGVIPQSCYPIAP